MSTVDFGGVTLHYTDEGFGEPIILIHGSPLSHEMWTPQRAVLSADYRVISPDLRGFGRSDPPHGPTTMATYADDIVALMDELGIGSATVAGMSMGGYVVMELLRRRPDRVRAIMLVATKMTPDTAAGRQSRNEMIRLAQAEGADAVADKMLPIMLTEQTRTQNAELTQFVRDMMAQTPVDGIVAALGAMRDRPDSTATLQALELPALILVGSEDKITPPTEAEAMHKAIRGSRLETIPYAAHLLNLEQPESVNELLLSFLTPLYQD
jgi:3-oxoadipate enol-lactonase